MTKKKVWELKTDKSDDSKPEFPITAHHHESVGSHFISERAREGIVYD
jgi:hypothetical protein